MDVCKGVLTAKALESALSIHSAHFRPGVEQFSSSNSLLWISVAYQLVVSHSLSEVDLEHGGSERLACWAVFIFFALCVVVSYAICGAAMCCTSACSLHSNPRSLHSNLRMYCSSAHSNPQSTCSHTGCVCRCQGLGECARSQGNTRPWRLRRVLSEICSSLKRSCSVQGQEHADMHATVKTLINTRIDIWNHQIEAKCVKRHCSRVRNADAKDSHLLNHMGSVLQSRRDLRVASVKSCVKRARKANAGLW